MALFLESPRDEIDLIQQWLALVWSRLATDLGGICLIGSPRVSCFYHELLQLGARAGHLRILLFHEFILLLQLCHLCLLAFLQLIFQPLVFKLEPFYF